METEISTHALTEGDRKDMFCSSVCMNFNSRPHGGRLAYWQQFLRREHFNSRPHGGRRAEKNSTWTAYYFNSRPHGGRRFSGNRQGRFLHHFNSRPHGGRQHEDSLCDRKIRHFNSRPHGGRRMTPLAVPLDKCISTHALTEGDRRL